MAYRWRALRVRVMVCYVLRPSPDNSYFGSRCSGCVYSGAVRKVVLIPARPAGLPAAARTALLVPASAAPLPIRPGGAPQEQVRHRITSVDFYGIKLRRVSV